MPSAIGRRKEVTDLLRAIENNEKLFVFSERRYGKTSLVRTALGKLPKKGYVCSYVDLWPTDSEATFVTAARPRRMPVHEHFGGQGAGDGEEVLRQSRSQRDDGRGRQAGADVRNQQARQTRAGVG